MALSKPSSIRSTPRTERGSQPDSWRLNVLERTEDYAIVTWGRILMMLWLTRPTARGVDRCIALSRMWALSQATVVTLVVVPPLPLGPPDEATRDAMARARRTAPSNFVGMATLFEESGFIAAFIRSLLASLRQFQEPRFSGHVFSTVSAAANWAADTLGVPGIDAERLQEAIRQGRELR